MWLRHHVLQHSFAKETHLGSSSGPTFSLIRSMRPTGNGCSQSTNCIVSWWIKIQCTMTKNDNHIFSFGYQKLTSGFLATTFESCCWALTNSVITWLFPFMIFCTSIPLHWGECCTFYYTYLVDVSTLPYIKHIIISDNVMHYEVHKAPHGLTTALKCFLKVLL